MGGLFVLGIVNLFFYYNMKVAQVDNTSDWIPERRGFLVEYREAHNVSDNSATSSGSSVEMLATLDFQQVAASLGEAMPEDNQEVAVENLEAEVYCLIMGPIIWQRFTDELICGQKPGRTRMW